jgi:hypothetical protein
MYCEMQPTFSDVLITLVSFIYDNNTPSIADMESACYLVLHELPCLPYCHVCEAVVAALEVDKPARARHLMTALGAGLVLLEERFGENHCS